MYIQWLRTIQKIRLCIHNLRSRIGDSLFIHSMNILTHIICNWILITMELINYVETYSPFHAKCGNDTLLCSINYQLCNIVGDCGRTIIPTVYSPTTRTVLLHTAHLSVRLYNVSFVLTKPPSLYKYMPMYIYMYIGQSINPANLTSIYLSIYECFRSPERYYILICCICLHL